MFIFAAALFTFSYALMPLDDAAYLCLYYLCLCHYLCHDADSFYADAYDDDYFSPPAADAAELILLPLAAAIFAC